VRCLLVAAAVVVLLGCQQSPSPQTAKAPLGSLTAQLKAEGDQLAARGEYEAAVVKYQAAVRQEPGEAPLWFALGTALSHLDQSEGTIRAFQRVLELGRPNSQEVEVARRWLVSAGVLTASLSFTSSTAGESASNSGAATAPSGPKGTLRGKTEWKGITPEHAISVKLIISPEESTTRGQSFSRSIRLGQPYTFENVPSGAYRLEASAGQTHLWDEKVYIETDKQTVLNLTPANSPVSPGTWPGAVEKDHNDGFGPTYDRTEHTRPPADTPPPAGESR
jgi:tetratricopeptide (TPR) repeat protein